MNSHIILPVLLFLSTLPAVCGADSGEACIEDWSAAVPVVKAEGLASVATVTDLVRQRHKGDVVKVTLCMQGQSYVYRVLLRGADGRHTPLIVDAKQPFDR